MEKQNNLSAPPLYWQKSNSNDLPYINSCGGTGINSLIIPDSLFGLDISDACNIHDYMYEQGINRKRADKLFLENMLLLINKDSNSKILKSLRKAKAYIYYLGVMLFGNFFFKKKNNRSI